MMMLTDPWRRQLCLPLLLLCQLEFSVHCEEPPKDGMTRLGPLLGLLRPREQPPNSETPTHNSTSKPSPTQTTALIHPTNSVTVTAEHLENTRIPNTTTESGKNPESQGKQASEQCRRLKTVVAVFVVVFVVAGVGLMHFKVSAAIRQACCSGSSGAEGKEQTIRSYDTKALPAYSYDGQKGNFYHQCKRNIHALSAKLKSIYVTRYSKGFQGRAESSSESRFANEKLMSGDGQHEFKKSDVSSSMSNLEVSKV